MKALINTLVLAAILVAAVLYLRTMPRDDRRPEAEPITEDIGTAERAAPPMAVKSGPATRSTLDAEELEDTNNAALYETGSELLDLWHVAEAVAVFEALVDKEADNLEAHYRLVECYSHPMIGSEKNARDRLRQAKDLAVDGDQDTLWVAALRALFVQPVPALAIDHFTQLVQRDEQDVTARRLLAQAYLHDRRPAEAQGHLEELLEGDRTLGRARELLVQTRVLLSDFDGAETLARDLAALYPEEPYPYVLLATVLLTAGKVRESVEFCNNALRIDKRYIPAIVARANLYAAQGQREAARVSFEKLDLFEDPLLQAMGAAGSAYVDFLSGNFDEAAEAMDEAIRISVSEGARRRALVYAFQLVDYLCELGRVDAANSVLKRWVSAQGDIPAHLGRLRVLISAGETPDAQAMLEQIQQDERWRAWMLALELDPVEYQALAYMSEKRFGRALEVLHSPKGEGVVGTKRVYLRAFALFQQGDAERAAKSFARTRFRLHSVMFPYTSDPVLRVQSIFFLGEAALARGESAAAKAYYREFLGYWGKADWDLQAVVRAREKLAALSPEKGDG